MRFLRLLTSLSLMLLPTALMQPLANAQGHAIGRGARIGHFNILRVWRLALPPDPATRIDVERVTALGLVETVYRKRDVLD